MPGNFGHKVKSFESVKIEGYLFLQKCPFNRIPLTYSSEGFYSSFKDFRFSGLSILNVSMFFLTAQYCCQNKRGKAEATSWLSHHPPLWREVPFCLPAVLNRGRGYKPLVTPVWLFTDQNPSSAVFDGSSSADPDEDDFFVVTVASW